MAFDPTQPVVPTPNIPQTPPVGGQAPAIDPTEQQIRTMRGDLSAPASSAPLPAFDAEEPAFTPETTTQVPSVDQLVGEGGGGKKPWLLLGGIGAFIVLALVGYFIVYPMFNKAAPDAGSPDTQPVVQPAQPVAPVTPVQPAPPHTSQFINEHPTAAKQLTAAGGTLTMDEVKGALVQMGQAAAPGITEIVLTQQGGQFSAQTFLVATAPSIEGYEGFFDPDFTAFIYKDNSGVWPGYVMQLKEGTTAAQISLVSSTIEKLALKNFFLVDPGKLAAFKDGMVNNLKDRYAPGSTPGASFGYLITKNKVLISTSFAGMKEALRLMGL